MFLPSPWLVFDSFSSVLHGSKVFNFDKICFIISSLFMLSFHTVFKNLSSNPKLYISSSVVSLKSYITLCKAEFITYFEFTFIRYKVSVLVQFFCFWVFFFAYEHWLALAPFVEKATFLLVNYLGPFIKTKLTICVRLFLGSLSVILIHVSSLINRTVLNTEFHSKYWNPVRSPPD